MGIWRWIELARDRDQERTYIEQNLFSPNGKYFLRYRYYEEDLQVYVFDRCTGALSLYDSVRIPVEEEFAAANASFSPNSRFIYANRNYHVLQLDLWADDLGASMDTIGSMPDSVLFPFEYHQLGPNGKIYINEAGQSPNLHVINKPNLKGDSCDFEVNGIVLPNDNFHSMPHFPYYRLGALEGSSCDTLTAVEEPAPKEEKGISIYPVPARE